MPPPPPKPLRCCFIIPSRRRLATLWTQKKASRTRLRQEDEDMEIEKYFPVELMEHEADTPTFHPDLESDPEDHL